MERSKEYTVCVLSSNKINIIIFIRKIVNIDIRLNYYIHGHDNIMHAQADDRH